jgi:membrane-associated phospholipid phosphatase
VATLVYLCAVSTLVLLDRDDAFRLHPTGGFGIAAVAILVVIALAQRYPRSRALQCVRITYPLVLAGFFYNAVESYVLALHGRFLDSELSAWDAAMVGDRVYALRDAVITPPFTEFMMLSYFSYYLYFIVPPAVLFARGRLDDLAEYVFAMSLTLYFCYLGFVLLPAVGPSLFPVPTPPLQGYAFTALQYTIMAQADATGATFPSGHVAGSFVAVLCIKRFLGLRPFLLVLPMFGCLVLSVVYTRFHYVIDVFAGLLVGTLGYSLTIGARGRIRAFWRRTQVAP